MAFLPSSAEAIVGVDTGGTFTDIILILPSPQPGTPSRLIAHKVLSTPEDPGAAVVQGVTELIGQISADERPAFTVVHGSTVATNALLERRGARTAFVTTAGFEDLLRIGRQTRRHLYDLRPADPGPLIDDDLVFGVRERVVAPGNVAVPLSREEIDRVAEAVARSGARSVAVCLLFSFKAPQHESLLASALAARGLFVSASHKVLPEYREYERAATTVINAYVSPLMQHYLASLERRLRSAGARRLHVMQSSGGCIAPGDAGELGVHTVLSGPAGGVLGAFHAARMAGIERIITFDMGGTSTDVSLVDGRIATTSESEIAGLPLRVPTLPIHTVGAGGGSIAYLDAGGALCVGPRSAGARPGPACYGLGGNEPTVTDAHVLLGRLPKTAFLGGRMELDEVAAARAVESLARRLGASLEETAWSILQVANVQMERAIRVISVEKGYDPQEFTLVSYGGAGGLHACDLARSLGIPRVLVPSHPGLLSAWGMAVADMVKTYSQGVIGPLESTLAAGWAALRELMARACRDLGPEARIDGVVSLEPAIDLRYLGQSFELAVPLPTVHWRTQDPLPAPPQPPASELTVRFHAAHERRYGHRADEPVEMVAVRLLARCRAAHHNHNLLVRPAEKAGMAKPAGENVVYVCGGPAKVPVFRREELPPGCRLIGPAVVAEAHATTLLNPGDVLHVDEAGNLLITVDVRRT